MRSPAKAKIAQRNFGLLNTLFGVSVLLVLVAVACGVPTAYADENQPQTLAPSQTNPDQPVQSGEGDIEPQSSRDITNFAPELPLGYALLVAIIGGLIAWIRVLVRFQRFWGLGVTRNLYTVTLITVIGALSGVFYLALASETLTGDGIIPVAWNWFPRFDSVAAVQIMTIVGGSFGGQVATIVGRFMRGARVETLNAAQVEELKKVRSSNFIYALIREGIATNIHSEISKLAQTFDQKTIQSTVIGLVTDQVTIGNISAAEGDRIKKQIEATKEAENDNQVYQDNYSILSSALRVSGFRQLQSRFVKVTG